MMIGGEEDVVKKLDPIFEALALGLVAFGLATLAHGSGFLAVYLAGLLLGNGPLPYRAGLLHGIAQGWDWESTGRLGSLMGAIKIAQRGPQNHKPSRNEIVDRYRKAFGSSPF